MPQESAVCRRAALEDLARICELGQEVNRLHHEQWPQFFAPSSDAKRDEAHWLQGIQGEAAATFVAHQGEAIIGFVSARIIDETNPLLQPMRFAQVGSVCVAERQRGRGVGRALMAHLEAWVASEGATDVRLNVWKFNTGAQHLYEELGYGVRSFSMGKTIQPRRGLGSTGECNADPISAN